MRMSHLLAHMLAGVADGTEAKWRKLVGPMQLMPTWKHVRHNWLVQARSFEPERKLAEKVRQTRARIAAAHISNPFTFHRPVNKPVVPHRPADVREAGRDLEDCSARNQRHLYRRQRLDVVIGDAENRILKIDHVALHVKRDNLPAAAADDLGAKGETRKKQGTMLRLVSVLTIYCVGPMLRSRCGSASNASRSASSSLAHRSIFGNIGASAGWPERCMVGFPSLAESTRLTVIEDPERGPMMVVAYATLSP
jgi:hypothetical protein